MSIDTAIRTTRRRRLETLLVLAQRARSWTRRDLASALGRDPSNLLAASGLPKADVVWRLAETLRWPSGEVLDAIVDVPAGAVGRCEPPGTARLRSAVDRIADLVGDRRVPDALALIRARLRDGASGSNPRRDPRASASSEEPELMLLLAAAQLAAGEATEAIIAAEHARRLVDQERGGAPIRRPAGHAARRAAAATLEALGLRLQHERRLAASAHVGESLDRAAALSGGVEPGWFTRCGLPGAATLALLAAARESMEVRDGVRAPGPSIAEATGAVVASTRRGVSPDEVDRVRAELQRCLWLVGAMLPALPHGGRGRPERPRSMSLRVDDERWLEHRLLRQAAAGTLDTCRPMLPICDDWSLRAEWFELEARRRRLGADRAGGGGTDVAPWALRADDIDAIAGLMGRLPRFRALGWTILDAARS